MAAVAVAASAARLAAADGLDGQRYIPAAGAAGGFVVERALVPHHLDYGFGLFLHYADDPVVVSDESTGDDVARPLEQALTLDLLASIGFFDAAELAIHLPVHVIYDGDETIVDGQLYAASQGIGDLRLVPKVALVRARSFGLGLALPVRLPTGDDEALRGAGDVTLEPKILLSWGAGRLALGVNLGYLVHASDEGREGPGGNELTFGGTLRYRLPTEDENVVLQAEVFGGWNPADDGESYHELPVEGLLGAIFELTPSWHLYVAGAAGISDGVGAPDFRALLGFRYTNVAFSDRDGDGVLDGRDRCPSAPEDRDEFEDEDGCPDSDNDGDRIRDDDDECPDAAEDRGGDGDGCPERGRAEYRQGRIKVYGKIRFKTNSAELRDSSDPILDDVATSMKRNPGIRKLRIEGHSDNVGDARYNKKLSRERALSVRQALIRRGVSPKRLEAEGHGEVRPITTNRTERGRAKNRRVEFRVVK